MEKIKAHIAVIGAKGLPAKGGGERVADAIVRHALRNGFKVTLYGKRAYCGSVDYGPDFDLIRITNLDGKHLGAFSFGILSALHALVFGKYDLVHLHYADFGYLVPLLRLRFKVIATSHGAEYNRDKWNRLVKIFFRLCEFPFVKFSTVCTAVSRNLAEYYTNRYSKKVYFIPNGIDTTLTGMSNHKSAERYGTTEYGYLVFAAGRIVPSKGCDLMLMANRKLKLNVPILVIGNIEDKRYWSYLQSLSRDNVRFIQFIAETSKLMDIISGSRLVIFPSLYEAMSMMLLEVASLRKGLVCSDIPENFDAIGDNAVFFRSGDSDDLAEKIRFALDNQPTITQLADRAYEFVRTSRDWNHITPEYSQLYKEVLQRQ